MHLLALRAGICRFSDWLLFFIGIGLVIIGDPTSVAAAEPVVAAKVNGEPIFTAEVDALLDAVRRTRPIGQDENRARADALTQLVNRKLVVQAISRDGTYVKPKELDEAMARLKSQLTSQKLTLEEYAARLGKDVESVKQDVIWELGWRAYVERHLADGIEAYFNAHRKEFDGTEIRASHILLRAERQGEPPSQLIARAEKIRADVAAGKATFDEAVQKYSAGPSREQKGDVGFFPRFGVMVEDFARTAFSLPIGELSKPVETPFGVHLIKVTDIKPGNKRWTEVVDRIKQAATVDLFNKLVETEKASAKIEYTGKAPYRNPETDEVVVPAG